MGRSLRERNGAPHTLTQTCSPPKYSPQDSLQAAQEGEMAEMLGGRQSWEGLGCEQES